MLGIFVDRDQGFPYNIAHMCLYGTVINRREYKRMRKGFARYMAGILAAQMVLSSGGPFVYGAQMENPVSVESQDQSGDGLEEDHMNGTETETPGEPEASESENPEGQEVPEHSGVEEHPAPEIRRVFLRMTRNNRKIPKQKIETFRQVK